MAGENLATSAPVDAVQWDGDRFLGDSLYRSVPDWLVFWTENSFIQQEGEQLRIKTATGTMTALPDDWIVCDSDGALRVYDSKAFCAAFGDVLSEEKTDG